MKSKIEPWQAALSQLITDPKDLFRLLEINDAVMLDAAYRAANIFPLRVTHSFLSRMEKGNVNDPLLKQVLPLGIELQTHDGYKQDPLEEKKANPVPGLLHKYYGRVLITLTSACAINCRYCFRRYFPYNENNPGRLGWKKIFAYINDDHSISEVILSGGDPLVVSNTLLENFCTELIKIPHVKRLRFHTRLPIVLPERITTQFIKLLQKLPLNVILVVHVNHPQEINAELIKKFAMLNQANVKMLNQSVLLKSVNDNTDTLVTLSEKLFNAGVLPYYLHVLDKVEGAAHFDLPLSAAKKLHNELTACLPGYLVPKLACEEAGALAKTLL